MEIGPTFAKMQSNKFSMTFVRDDAQSDSDFLNEIEKGDEKGLRQNESIAPQCPGLGCCDDAAHIGVGEHHRESWTDKKKPSPKCSVTRPSYVTHLAVGTKIQNSPCRRPTNLMLSCYDGISSEKH